MRAMKSRSWCSGILTAGILLLSTSVLHGQPAESEHQATAEIGGHVSDVNETVVRVREFDLGRQELQPDLWLDSSGRSGTNLYDLFLHYYDEQTLDADVRVNANRYVDTRFRHRSTPHWLDHDRLDNLQWRESLGPDTLGVDQPGGKMITSEDTDAGRDYRIRYVETKYDVRFALPFLPGASAEAKYRDQIRTGHRQVTSVEHCSNCHVRSRGGEVNEQTRDLLARFSAQIKPAWLTYEFYTRDQDNDAAPVTNRYMQARNPANGGSIDEFASRLLYDNQELQIARGPDVEKTGHSVEARIDLPRRQALTGSGRYAKSKNAFTGYKMTSNAGLVSWAAPISRTLRLAARFIRRQIENDEVPIDLPDWRAGRPGGDQDFDYVRRSAYDRTEYVATVNGVYALRQRHSLRFGYRFWSTDRKNFVLSPDDPNETTTIKNTINLAWNGRLSRETRSRIAFEYELTDNPFVSVGGLCEAAIGDTVMPIGGNQPNDWAYYWQRQRIGTGANQPSDAFRVRANVSYSFDSEVSVTGFLNWNQEKNDKLNLYEYEGSMLNPGGQLMWVPDPRVAVVGGGSYSLIKSNAKICATVMDG